MSRAQGVRTLFDGKQAATQTCTPRIQIAGDLNPRKLSGGFVPELGARGLRGEKARRRSLGGATSRTALIAIGQQS